MAVVFNRAIIERLILEKIEHPDRDALF
jgi:hypothetical protein